MKRADDDIARVEKQIAELQKELSPTEVLANKQLDKKKEKRVEILIRKPSPVQREIVMPPEKPMPIFVGWPSQPPSEASPPPSPKQKKSKKRIRSMVDDSVELLSNKSVEFMGVSKAEIKKKSPMDILKDAGMTAKEYLRMVKRGKGKTIRQLVDKKVLRKRNIERLKKLRRIQMQRLLGKPAPSEPVKISIQLNPIPKREQKSQRKIRSKEEIQAEKDEKEKRKTERNLQNELRKFRKEEEEKKLKLYQAMTEEQRTAHNAQLAKEHADRVEAKRQARIEEKKRIQQDKVAAAAAELSRVRTEFDKQKQNIEIRLRELGPAISRKQKSLTFQKQQAVDYAYIDGGKAEKYRDQAKETQDDLKDMIGERDSLRQSLKEEYQKAYGKVKKVRVKKPQTEKQKAALQKLIERNKEKRQGKRDEEEKKGDDTVSEEESEDWGFLD